RPARTTSSPRVAAPGSSMSSGKLSAASATSTPASSTRKISTAVAEPSAMPPPAPNAIVAAPIATAAPTASPRLPSGSDRISPRAAGVNPGSGAAACEDTAANPGTRKRQCARRDQGERDQQGGGDVA